MIALKNEIYAYHAPTNQLTLLAQPEIKPEIRFNDGKCDPQGRFWVGTMSMTGKKGDGELYCMHRDGTLKKVLEGVSISNGLAWDQEKSKMYYIDTPTQQVFSFDFDSKTGEISNRSVVYTFREEDGSPDGMTIDADGMLWVALWGGGKVAKVNPEEKRWVDSVDVPASLVTSCVFGGDDLQTLYITTARIGLSETQLEKEPYSGGLFSVRLGVKGTPSYLFL